MGKYFPGLGQVLFRPNMNLTPKAKMLSLNGWNLEKSSDLNPISYECHLTQFYPLTIWINIRTFKVIGNNWSRIPQILRRG